MLSRKNTKKVQFGLKCRLKPGLLVILCLLPSLVLAKSPEVLTVLVSVRPIALIVEEMTVGLPVEVPVLLKAGSTPHEYALKPSDVLHLKQADLTVWLGPKSELYLTKPIFQSSRNLSWESLATLHQLPLRNNGLVAEGDVDHDHGYSLDPHFWFDTHNALLLSQSLELELGKLRPDWIAVLKQNGEQFRLRIQQNLDKHKAGLRNAEAFFSVHDAHYYLEKNLGLHSIGAIISDPEIQPGIKHILFMKQQIQQHQARCVITDPTISTAVLDKLDGQPPLRRVSIDPLGWDFEGNRFSAWLEVSYQKILDCLLK